MEINNIVKNEIYINKCIDLLNKLCFKINNEEFTERLNNTIIEYKDLLDDIESSSLKNKAIIRTAIKEKYLQKFKGIDKHQDEVIGVLVSLVKAISRNYKLKSKNNGEENKLYQTL